MEMMEYSARGKLDYAGSTAKKYYGGPNSYLIKEEGYFIDTTSNRQLNINQETAQQYSSQVRENLLFNYNARAELETIDYDYSLIDNAILSDDDLYVDDMILSDIENEFTSEQMGNMPGFDSSPIIVVPDTMGTYIPNYQYFFTCA